MEAETAVGVPPLQHSIACQFLPVVCTTEATGPAQGGTPAAHKLIDALHGPRAARAAAAAGLLRHRRCSKHPLMTGRSECLHPAQGAACMGAVRVQNLQVTAG